MCRQYSSIFKSYENSNAGDTHLHKSISGLEVNLVIVGNGDLRQELEVLARDVNANVEFWGGVSDKKLQGAYGAADVFILP